MGLFVAGLIPPVIGVFHPGVFCILTHLSWFQEVVASLENSNRDPDVNSVYRLQSMDIVDAGNMEEQTSNIIHVRLYSIEKKNKHGTW